MFNIKKEIREAFSENKPAIIVSIAILFVSLILGYIFEPSLYTYLNPVVEDLSSKIETGVIQLTFEDIFFNNIMIVFQMFIYGIFFCFSSLVLAFNGFFVGYYVATLPDLFEALILIVPHGIFEFSSCILACSASFVLFNFIYKFISDLIKIKDMKFLGKIDYSFSKNFDKLKQALILLLISSILMIIAGIIEVYITIPFAKFIISIVG